MRPQSFYRQQFRELILAERAASVLEVGAGDGDCVRFLRERGIAAVGLEADAAKVESARGQGLPVELGAAEALPFAAGSFDLVVSEYSAHHFADLRRHLAEALRVARRGVFVLDPWYDLTIPSQRVAERWDRWFKAIDRGAGKVHHDVLSADDFRRALPALCTWSFECRHMLRLVSVDDAFFAEQNAPFVAAVRGAADEAKELAELAVIAAARTRDGLSDDGAIVVLLHSPGRSRGAARF